MNLPELKGLVLNYSVRIIIIKKQYTLNASLDFFSASLFFKSSDERYLDVIDTNQSKYEPMSSENKIETTCGCMVLIP